MFALEKTTPLQKLSTSLETTRPCWWTVMLVPTFSASNLSRSSSSSSSSLPHSSSSATSTAVLFSDLLNVNIFLISVG